MVNVSMEAKVEDAQPSQPTNDSIPESWTYQYDPVGRGYEIVYGGSTKENNPQAKAIATPLADSSLPSQISTPKRETVEVDAGNPWSSSISKSHQTSGGSSSARTTEMASDIPMNPFADSAGAKSTWDIYSDSGDEADILVTSKSGPTSCIICTDDFSATLKPPVWITVSCLHKPSACCECLARCIKSDLESKIWNQITCPECKTLLVYEDIRRLADPETFAKYVITIIPA
jgi:hypothetical protein